VPKTTTMPLPASIPDNAKEVLDRVNELVPVLRTRAPETEKLRRMHPDSLRDLAEAGVFRLTVPADVGATRPTTKSSPRSSRRSPHRTCA
jgi:alkylation response protein AidB-like acyl-CoA dehydrogenase